MEFERSYVQPLRYWCGGGGTLPFPASTAGAGRGGIGSLPSSVKVNKRLFGLVRARIVKYCLPSSMYEIQLTGRSPRRGSTQSFSPVNASKAELPMNTRPPAVDIVPPPG